MATSKPIVSKSHGQKPITAFFTKNKKLKFDRPLPLCPRNVNMASPPRSSSAFYVPPLRKKKSPLCSRNVNMASPPKSKSSDAFLVDANSTTHPSVPSQSFVNNTLSELFVSENVLNGIKFLRLENPSKNVVIDALKDIMSFLDDNTEIEAERFRITAIKKWNNVGMAKKVLLPDVPINHGNELRFGVEGIVVKHYAPFSNAQYSGGGQFDKIDPSNPCIAQFIKRIPRVMNREATGSHDLLIDAPIAFVDMISSIPLEKKAILKNSKNMQKVTDYRFQRFIQLDTSSYSHGLNSIKSKKDIYVF